MAKSKASSSDPYRADLAFIHDTGFGQLAEAAATELLARLRRAKLTTGTVIDLGCGSGTLSEKLAAAGYDVVGFDISPDMIELARKRVPQGTFHCLPLLSARLPRAVAVAAIGEVFNYLFDSRHSVAKLPGSFRRVHRALAPGGIFLFDMAGPGRSGKAGQVRAFTETSDWACLYAASEDRSRQILARQITTYRRQGQTYRRDHEVHRLRLVPPRPVIQNLREAGFSARSLKRYADFEFPAGWTGFLARKE
ncbi:MAG: class I SAM-dependent methyltransferase [Singulisphaera sp.]